MKLLVVTPTLGTSPWLESTVASVVQAAPDAMHVLVAPAEKCAALRLRFPQPLILPEPGGGMYAAINAGVAASAIWDAFTYLNDDDLLLPDFAAVVAAVTPERAQFVYGRVRLIDAGGQRLGAIPVSRFPAQNRALYAQRLEPVYQHGTVITRAAWEQASGFDAAFRLCGDSEFLARLCVAGVPAAFVNREVAAFRLHRGQLTKRRADMVAERAKVDEKLGLRAGPGGAARWWARGCFRLANAPVYAERIRRHGFLSFDELLERGG